MTRARDARDGPGAGKGHTAGPPTPAVARIEAAAVPPDYRPGRPADAPDCAAIWELSIADYERRLAQPVISLDRGPVTRLIEHLAATDPERFWVAERAGRVVGFGQASIRGGLWFLGLLFVMPEEQAKGVGRELLARTMPRGGSPTVLGTVSDAAQPISNALYAKLGLVPRLPAYRLVGRPDRTGALGALPPGIEAVGVAAQRGVPAVALDETAILAGLDAIDRELLGSARHADHAWRRAAGRAYLYRRTDGTPVGYGYAVPSGSIGPVATLDPALLAPVVGHLLDAHPPAGASSVIVTGEAPGLFRALLEAGLRIDGFPALLCWTEPFAPLDRYLLGSYALP